ncbi:hypothetical protein CEXT_620311 [Caerostris extrusa]|uniref:Uncharacterized protein n=1 Tax=Caerostris extrusa TaxID=172846 RepID=A0AAV4WVH1_CAEEX|nr:hypothetical protein CEXT_620311 [Caerostris extrusa]
MRPFSDFPSLLVNRKEGTTKKKGFIYIEKEDEMLARISLITSSGGWGGGRFETYRFDASVLSAKEISRGFLEEKMTLVEAI